MTEIFNLNALCRCCHADGALKSLQAVYAYDGETEIYAVLLRETFGLHITLSKVVASYAICEHCIDQLRLAHRFKQQVLACEKKFEEYCKKEENDELVIKSEREALVPPPVDDVITYEVNIDDVKTEKCFDDVADVCEEENDELDIKSETGTESTVPPPVDDVHTDDFQTEECLEIGAHGGGKDTKKGSQRFEQANKRHYCHYCTETFTSINTLKKHEHYSHTKDGFVCGHCQKVFKYKKSLLGHIQNHCRNMREFVCETCGRAFNSHKDLKRHLSTVHDKLRFKCDLCEKSYSQKCRLVYHRRSHTGENPSKGFVCETCGRAFSTNTVLKRHVSSVHYELRFECDFCEKSYSHKTSLDYHKKYHTAEIPFVCHLCSEEFISKKNLREHKCQEHLYTKGYVCDFCRKVFKWRKGLLRHMRDHMGNSKEFRCETCGRTFKFHSHLKRHVSGVHDKLRFQCDLCEKSYSRKSKLVYHRRSHIVENPLFVKSV